MGTWITMSGRELKKTFVKINISNFRVIYWQNDNTSRTSEKLLGLSFICLLAFVLLATVKTIGCTWEPHYLSMGYPPSQRLTKAYSCLSAYSYWNKQTLLNISVMTSRYCLSRLNGNNLEMLLIIKVFNWWSSTGLNGSLFCSLCSLNFRQIQLCCILAS